jgi:molecular chaperone DnaK
MAQREPYGLGIDAGTTFTAAAVATARGAEIVTLGGRIDTVPSAIYVPGEGPDVIGEAAVRRAVTEPARVARWFKRRIGDPTPLVIGGRPYPAEALTAKLLRWAVEQASAERGGPPGAVAVTHPANWGPFKLDVFAQALTIAELRGATLLPEPVAAARYYATSERLSPGDVVAVYDLGGGTFDATVLRATAGGFDILGEPEGLEHLGGLDFDQAVFGFVLTAIGTTADALDLSDPATAGAVARLRQECTEAKEALSSDSDVRIPVLLPGVQRDVRLTRGELESMMEPAIETSIGALRRAITSARVEPEAVEAILLVGGASRTPLVAQMLSASFGRRIALDAHPKHAVALGAALAAAEALGARGPAVEPPRAEAEIAEAGAETGGRSQRARRSRRATRRRARPRSARRRPRGARSAVGSPSRSPPWSSPPRWERTCSSRRAVTDPPPVLPLATTAPRVRPAARRRARRAGVARSSRGRASPRGTPRAVRASRR